MKCTPCRGPAEISLRAHNAAFCRACFVQFFERQVERAIRRNKMLSPNDHVLVAVSGGKDSLALWHVLVAQGYQTTGLHLALGIGTYSEGSRKKTEAFAAARGLPLIVKDLATEAGDISVPTVSRFTNRPPCGACGKLKRHLFDQAASEGPFTALATGHNLDDEAARLLGNVLHWQNEYLAKQQPVLLPTHPKFVSKVRPLYLLSELETAVYAFFKGIDYDLDECPNSAGAKQLTYKATLNRLEHEMPGTKMSFVKDFQRRGQQGFTATDNPPPGECRNCGMPAYGEVCAFCRLLQEVQTKRARAAQSHA